MIFVVERDDELSSMISAEARLAMSESPDAISTLANLKRMTRTFQSNIAMHHSEHLANVKTLFTIRLFSPEQTFDVRQFEFDESRPAMIAGA